VINKDCGIEEKEVLLLSMPKTVLDILLTKIVVVDILNMMFSKQGQRQKLRLRILWIK